MPLTKDAHAHAHVLSGTSQRACCPFQWTKEPFQRLVCPTRDGIWPIRRCSHPPQHTTKVWDTCTGRTAASPTSPPAVVTDARRTPPRAGSCPCVHHGPAVPLALPIRTRALDGDADQRAPVSRHRPTIVVPIRMFPGQAPIIIHQRFHGVG